MPDHRVELPNNDLELKLAGFVRLYIQAYRQVDSSEQEDALRWVCSGMEYLVDGLLQQCKGWNGWVDGICPATDMLPDAIGVMSSVELSLRGWALWGETVAAGPFWIEPFFAGVRISETSDAIVSYEFRFADATRGLGKVPHGKHLRRSDWFFPKEWLFTFSKGSLAHGITPARPK